MRIEPPSYAAGVLSRLEALGYSAWFVGGCVRDGLLGREPADWDIAASSLPAETAACFPGLPVVRAGEKHGTVGIVTAGGVVEVTTYRVDGAYTGRRRPERVDFAGRVEEDLARRDFTINAMAWHPERGLMDLFGGEQDLSRGLVRCVGEPERRFGEDALRILRCLRFGAALGFRVEEETGRAALGSRELLGEISGERVREELTKLLLGPGAGRMMREYRPVMLSALPELGAGSYYNRSWEQVLRAVDRAPREAVTRWGALLLGCEKAREALARLGFPRREREAVGELTAHGGEALPLTGKRVRELLGELGEEQTFRLLGLLEAERPEDGALLQEAGELAREVLRRGECLTLRDLEVKGSDLLGVGFAPGKSLGTALNALLSEVLEGTLPNERPALLARAGELLGRAYANM